jgi:hypothetical protein
MKYYLHDSNSFNDEKITDLYINFGYEGLGLFYTALEKLAMQEKPIKTSVLKSQLKVGRKLEKCWLFMESLGILSSKNGYTFSEQLLNFSQKYQIKKEKNKEKIKQWRENQIVIENVTSYEPLCNSPKVNKSKVKESKVKEVPTQIDFLSFCKTELGVNYSGYEFALKAKYETWVGDGWKDGNGSEINNWKSKIKNTIPYLKQMQTNFLDKPKGGNVLE